MQTHPYYGPGNIVIDTCGHCNAIWLDHGELGRAVNAPGRDRGAALLRGKGEKKYGKDKKDKKGKKSKKKRKSGLMDLLEELFD